MSNLMCESKQKRDAAGDRKSSILSPASLKSAK